MSHADQTQTSLPAKSKPVSLRSPGTLIFERMVHRFLRDSNIEVGGENPWDITVTDRRFYRRFALKGSLGLGEAYMDGWWHCEQLDELFYRLLSGCGRCGKISRVPNMLSKVHAKIVNRQSRTRAYIVGERHYDVGNELYQLMLDPYMAYTCAYWEHSSTLDDAQKAKLDLVCRKIGLREGDTVLDVGCGWGSFARYAAEHYGAKVTGITISKEQLALARERCDGLPVDLHLCDYREFRGSFDHVVSLGMMEHVGVKNYRTYMEKIHDCLRPGGLALIQVIGSPASMCATDPWLDRYIFPNSMLPSVKQIGDAIDGVFHMEDWHSFGHDYDRTLMAWHQNFEEAWEQLRDRYDERFHRMWRYYLLLCAGIFRARRAQLWQLVLAKGGVAGGYKAVR